MLKFSIGEPLTVCRRLSIEYMKEGTIIYNKKTFTGKTKIFIKNEMVHFQESSLFTQEYLQIPLERLGKTIAFSRVYHLGPLISSSGIFIMSLFLIEKTRNSTGDAFYISLGIASFIFLGYIYYFMYGKQFGAVELEFADSIKDLQMTEEEYWILKEALNQINP